MMLCLLEFALSCLLLSWAMFTVDLGNYLHIEAGVLKGIDGKNYSKKEAYIGNEKTPR